MKRGRIRSRVSRESSARETRSTGGRRNPGVRGQAPRFRERMLTKRLTTITPALVGHSPDMPPIDKSRVAEAASSMISRGPLEAVLGVLGSIFVLNVISIFTRGTPLAALEQRSQEDILSKAFKSRFLPIRGASVIVAIPVKIAYYNGDEVCRSLGFDRALLVNDALKHQVTRDRGPLKK